MDNLNFGHGNSYNFSNSGAVAGTGSSYTSTAATNACINGKFTTPLAVQTNAATPVIDAGTQQVFVPVPPGNCCSMVFGVNFAGVLQMAQGKVLAIGAGNALVPGPLVLDPQFPGLPNDFVALAYTVVRTAPNAASWLPGTSAWAASGVVASAFVNVAQLSNRPQAQ